ncbi:MAG TPA: aspartate/glutamate racemase family protein [Candidatus Heimdallarchaeota archaeon]|nr:aspartate/glutamate racemase family protein [Candidatus Heimdallarchaeota archaeon]
MSCAIFHILNILDGFHRVNMLRKHTIQTLSLIVIGILVFSSCTDRQTFAKEDNLANFFSKREVTIAVTDSGLGGLSILGDAAERMKKENVFQKVHFVFFNALFSNEGGYNSLKTRDQKIEMFNSALESLEEKYSPDLILIGCNTLSVLYSSTSFSQNSIIPVVGIVKSGVDLIAQNLRTHPESKVILFGTQTTVSEGTYTQKLEERGFLPERVIPQACPELVSYIEKGYDSDETEMLILAYVDEALQKLGNPEPELYVSFNCTHYGYSLELWEKAFESLGVKPRAFLNPNFRMNDFLFQSLRTGRYKKTNVSVRVVSMVEIEKKRIRSIGTWLERLSPQTADALRNYTHDPKLFEWEKFVSGEG